MENKKNKEKVVKIKKEKKLLYSKDSKEVVEIMKGIEGKSKEETAKWAILAAEELAEIYARHNETECGQMRQCVLKGRLWANKLIKMGEAKTAILSLHKRAREEHGANEAVLRAIAQAVSVMHTVKHAVGVVIYALTATKKGIDCRGIFAENPKGESEINTLGGKEKLDSEKSKETISS